MKQWLLSILFIGMIWLPFQGHAQSNATTRPFIIDTDMIFDDAIAVLYFLKVPHIQVKAILVDGNASAHCKAGVDNTLRILQLLNYKKIPVSCGPTTALGYGHTISEKIRINSDRLLDMPLPKLKRKPYPRSATQLLITTLKSSTRKTNILAIGSLTIIAKALLKNPTIKHKIGTIYFMGGAINVKGNLASVMPKTRNTRAEWNIYFDPLAVDIVFQSGIPIVLIPLDATNQVPITMQFINKLARNQNTPAAKSIYGMFKRHMTYFSSPGYWYFWDPLAAAVASDPSLCRYQYKTLLVKLKPADELGVLVTSPKGNRIQVCEKVDAPRFNQLLFKVLNLPAHK